MRIPQTPWTAPSAAVYSADGLPVCTLGTSEMVKAYRQRGDQTGGMIADTAQLIAAAPALLEALQDLMEYGLLLGMNEDSSRFINARAAVDLTVRPLSPCERGEVLTVPR